MNKIETYIFIRERSELTEPYPCMKTTRLQ